MPYCVTGDDSAVFPIFQLRFGFMPAMPYPVTPGSFLITNNITDTLKHSLYQA